MEVNKELPESSQPWEVAKAALAEEINRAKSLLDDLDHHGVWPNCFRQLADSVVAVKRAAEALAALEATQGVGE